MPHERLRIEVVSRWYLWRSGTQRQLDCSTLLIALRWTDCYATASRSVILLWWATYWWPKN